MNKKTVTIELLGKNYQIKCPETEVDSLQKAAKMLEAKMQSARETAQVISHDKIAVITSLNLAHQIMKMEEQTNQYVHSIGQRLNDLQNKLDSALTHKSEMEFASVD